MRYKKCPKCKGSMINLGDFYRCSQCGYEAKTKEEIDQLKSYDTKV